MNEKIKLILVIALIAAMWVGKVTIDQGVGLFILIFIFL